MLQNYWIPQRKLKETIFLVCSKRTRDCFMVRITDRICQDQIAINSALRVDKIDEN